MVPMSNLGDGDIAHSSCILAGAMVLREGRRFPMGGWWWYRFKRHFHGYYLHALAACTLGKA